jgi:hypothetical protein
MATPTETLCSPLIASELSGAPLDLVRGWIASGKLPIRKVSGSQRFVCLEDCDLLHAEATAPPKPRRIHEISQGRPDVDDGTLLHKHGLPVADDVPFSSAGYQ